MSLKVNLIYKKVKENIVEQIREQIDILDLIREYVPMVKRSGINSYKACCPFHQEKTPSFTINPDKGFFYCFGCQSGGDIFTFLMKIENLSFNEAVRKLAERAGIDYHNEETMTEEERARLNLYKLMTFAGDFYHKQLFSEHGAQARTYIKDRNLSKETADKFMIGLSLAGGLSAVAQKAGFSVNELKQVGLISQATGNDIFRNRLMFPIANHRGEIVAFGGRILGEGQPKYLNSPDTPLFSKSRILYALNFAGPSIRKKGRAVLLEGYMDVIASHQAGISYCVAPLGTSFNEGHAKLLKRYTDSVTILFDPDSAGQKASLRTALILLENGFYVNVAVLPDGLDPDEYIAEYGAESFENIIMSGKDIINYELDKIFQNNVSLTPQQKTIESTNLLNIIASQKDRIIKAEWLQIVSNRLNISLDILQEKLRFITMQKAKEQKLVMPKTEVKKVESKKIDFPLVEQNLISLLLQYPQYIALCENFDVKTLSNQQTCVILKEIALLQQQESAIGSFGFIQKLIENKPELKETILELSVKELIEGVKPKQEIPNLLKKIEKEYLQRRFKELQQKLSAYGAGEAPVALLREQIEIQKKLKSRG